MARRKRPSQKNKLTRYFGKCPPTRKGRRTSSRKLADKKINTLVEKRMQQIARKEDQRNRLNLILRQYWYAGGMHTTHNMYPAGQPVFFDGRIEQIGEIEKQDINQVLNQPRVYDGDEFNKDGQPKADVDGANQGIDLVTRHGRRATDSVKVTGLSLSLKVLFEAVQVLVQDHQQIGGMDGNEVAPEQPPAVPRRLETIQLQYALIGVKDEGSVQGQAGADPEVEEILPYRFWGYSPALDAVDKHRSSWYKKKVFIKDKITCNVNSIRDKDMTIDRFVRFPKPITIQYTPADQTGSATFDWKFFMVLRSNVPNTSGNQTFNYTKYAPKVLACTKVHYFE